MSVGLKEHIFWWSNNFPLDRIWREKYKIPFNSKKHRKTCQIDILFDLLEDRLFREYYKEELETKKRLKDYEETGEMFYVSEEEEQDRFDKFIPIDQERFRLIKK